ncbi:MAG: membrane protein of unknown function [Promethearchaeota archaeon]|nr:MAG: membrane protein of unknown function [Candidatus Lokiarchaeota archaeon]
MKEIQSEEAPNDNELKLLKNAKFWRERLKLDSWGKYPFIFLYILHIIDLFLTYDFISNFTNYLLDMMLITTILFAVYIVKKIKYSFQDLMIKNSSIFKSEESFRYYNSYLIEKYRTKKEFYIPIILYLIWFSISFTNNFEFIFTDTYGIQNPDLVFLGHILRIGAYTIWYTVTFVWILVVGSTLIIFITTFICINKLGSKEYPLKVTYEDLKIGAFEQIGKFIISLSIPAILIGTFFSIIGLTFIFFVRNFFYGYTMLGVSLFITIIFAFLLYKNTIHIHEAIVSYKTKLKQRLIKQIQKLSFKERNVSEINEEYMIYSTIYNLHDYYERVDNINDWPFNPTSLKKLFITFSSSVLPFFLSFIGIA